MSRIILFAVVVLPTLAFAAGALPGQQTSEVHLVSDELAPAAQVRRLAQIHEELEALQFSRGSVTAPVVVGTLGLVGMSLGIALAVTVWTWGAGLALTVALAALSGGVAMVSLIVAAHNMYRGKEIDERERELRNQVLLMRF